MNYWFTTITRDKVLESNQLATSWTTNANLLLERWLIFRQIPGDKKDFLNGDRVYRIHKSAVYRLSLDDLGRRFVSTRVGEFFFDTNDPTSGKGMKDEIWLPVGP